MPTFGTGSTVPWAIGLPEPCLSGCYRSVSACSGDATTGKEWNLFTALLQASRGAFKENPIKSVGLPRFPNGGHGVPERFEEKRKLTGGENRGLTRIDADKVKPLSLSFGVSARNQRLSAFIRGSKLSPVAGLRGQVPPCGSPRKFIARCVGVTFHPQFNRADCSRTQPKTKVLPRNSP